MIDENNSHKGQKIQKNIGKNLLAIKKLNKSEKQQYKNQAKETQSFRFKPMIKDF